VQARSRAVEGQEGGGDVRAESRGVEGRGWGTDDKTVSRGVERKDLAKERWRVEERDRWRERGYVYVYVCGGRGGWVGGWVGVCGCVWLGVGDGVCVCVCVCARARVCVCVCVIHRRRERRRGQIAKGLLRERDAGRARTGADDMQDKDGSRR
jgi:hypothetical protein